MDPQEATRHCYPHWKAESASEKAYKAGRTSALEAIDQAGQYGGVEAALDAYFENLGSIASGEEARQGFADVLSARGIAYRPHGLQQ